MKPHKFQLERNNCFPLPTDPTLDNAGQQMVGLQGQKGVLLNHVQLAVHHDPGSIFVKVPPLTTALCTQSLCRVSPTLYSTHPTHISKICQKDSTEDEGMLHQLPSPHAGPVIMDDN